MAQSTAYPRIYEYGPVAKMLWSVTSMLMIGAGVVTALSWMVQMDTWLRLLLIVVGISFAGFGAVCLISTFRGRLILHEDRLEYFGVLATRRIRFQDIAKTAQFTRMLGHFGATLVLKSGKRVAISDFGKMDSFLDAWLESFPNEEFEGQVAEQETVSAAVGKNPAFGNTEDERHARYNRHNRVASWLGLASIALSGTCIFVPLPHRLGLYILMAIPLLCVVAVLLSQRRWSVTEDITAGRVSLWSLPFFPIMALALVAVNCSTMVGWLMPIAGAAGIGLLMTIVVLVVERRFRWSTAISTLILCTLYAGSTMLLLNNFLDDAPPRIEHARVSAKRTSTASAPDYYLKLENWRSFDSTEYEVSRELYDGTKPGDQVCMAVYPGALRWEYLYVEACPAPANS